MTGSEKSRGSKRIDWEHTFSLPRCFLEGEILLHNHHLSLRYSTTRFSYQWVGLKLEKLLVGGAQPSNETIT